MCYSHFSICAAKASTKNFLIVPLLSLSPTPRSNSSHYSLGPSGLSLHPLHVTKALHTTWA